MHVRIQRWGDALAVPIPEPVAQEAHVEQGAMVDLRLAEGRLIVTPVAADTYTLEELLAGVTDGNIHSEVDTGPVRGFCPNGTNSRCQSRRDE